MSLRHKLNRYKHLVADFTNWPAFLFFKSSGAAAFTFKMKNGFEIRVPRNMMPPFKESFFDRVYLKHFDNLFLGNEQPTIIDIGGNVGFFSLFMLSQYPKARVIAFEPMPFNFKQLKVYKESYAHLNWEIENKAVSDTNDPLVLFSSTVDGFSTMASVFTDDKKGKRIEVPSLTYDQIDQQYALGQVDLMKLDCEGSEYAILYSLSDEQLNRIKNFSIETHPGDTPETTHAGLLKFLRSKRIDFKETMNQDGTGYIWAWH